MASLAVEQQRGMNVTYKGIRVGEYIVDFLVEDPVLIELKTVRALDRASSRAMHQLPPGDRKTHVPAAQFRHVPPRASTRRSGPVSHAPQLPTTPHNSRSFSAIGVYLRYHLSSPVPFRPPPHLYKQLRRPIGCQNRSNLYNRPLSGASNSTDPAIEIGAYVVCVMAQWATSNIVSALYYSRRLAINS